MTPPTATQPAIMTEAELHALVGHRFPGGHYRMAHWENFLLTDCTGRDQLPDQLVHPVVLFHAPILGAGTSIAELFVLGGAAGAGSVGLEGYDWEYAVPLREDIDYAVSGGIVSAERTVSDSGAVADRVAFSIELHHDGALHARITNRWRFRRTPGSTGGSAGSAPVTGSAPSSQHDPADPTTDAGEVIPGWSMDSVDPARMRTMAAILRDPYPVHWDRAANEAIGLGGRVVNQGPLNLSYIVNMLLAWAGPTCVRRLTVSFGRPVLDGDHVIAGGRVLSTETVDGEPRAQCQVWLERDGEHVVDGTAIVALAN